MKGLTKETLAKLAVVNRPAWRDFQNEVEDRRNTLIHNIITLADYGDLRMAQGRLAEIASLQTLINKVNEHLEGA